MLATLAPGAGPSALLTGAGTDGSSAPSAPGGAACGAPSAGPPGDNWAGLAEAVVDEAAVAALLELSHICGTGACQRTTPSLPAAERLPAWSLVTVMSLVVVPKRTLASCGFLAASAVLTIRTVLRPPNLFAVTLRSTPEVTSGYTRPSPSSSRTGLVSGNGESMASVSPSGPVSVPSGPAPPPDRCTPEAAAVGRKPPAGSATSRAFRGAQLPACFTRCCSGCWVRARWPSGVAAVSLNSSVSSGTGTRRPVALARAIALSAAVMTGFSLARLASASAMVLARTGESRGRWVRPSPRYCRRRRPASSGSERERARWRRR